MLVKTINVFGKVTIEHDRLVITNTFFTEKDKGWPATMTVEDLEIKEIPFGQVGELVYGLMVESEGDEVRFYSHTLQPIEGVELADLAIVQEYVSQVAGSVKLFSKAPAI